MSDEFSVLALAGNWGVGKTYLWQQYISQLKPRLPSHFNGVSYVSLFGVSTLAELRARATGSMALRKDRKKILIKYKNEAKVSLIPYDLVSSGLSKIVQLLGSGWVGLATEATYWFLRDSLVCLDDIERADATLTPSTIMGFIDELRNKGCKVVLILNREKAQQDEEFERYWEKVVDIDLRLRPKVSENVSLAFGSTVKEAKYAEWARSVFEAVDADNIRVHKRAAWLIREIDPHIAGLSEDLRLHIVKHAALLTWALTDASACIPVDVALSSNYGYMYLTLTEQAGTTRELSDYEKRWVEATDRVGFAPAGFDRLLADLINTGWCDTTALAAAFRQTQAEFRTELARQRLREMFRRYQEALNLDRSTYVTQLRCVLAEELESLTLFEFDSGLESLKRNGDDGADLVAAYIAKRGPHLQAVAEAPERNQSPKDARLATEITRREQEYQRTRYTIDSVAHDFMTGDSWAGSQLRFIASQTPDDFKRWMYSEPSNLKQKVNAILRFRGVDEALYKTATRSLEQALRQIAGESDFNRERIASVYGIGPINSGGQSDTDRA